MSTSRPLRIGLIGTGTIAFSAHLPAIARLRDEYELVAVADIREDNAARAAEEFGAESHYTDYRDMLAREQLDVVDICTPEFLHAEQTEAAAEAGVHVICEKPMSNSVAGAERMIAACEQAGVVLMIAHSRRFTGRYRRIKEAIDQGVIGEVRYVRENERRPRAMYDQLDLGTGYWHPEEGRPWVEHPDFTVGAALTNAVHETDLTLWFVGRKPRSIYAEARTTAPDGQVPDMLSYTIEFEGGAIGATEVVNRLPPGYPYFHFMEVIGVEGSLRALDPEQRPFLVADQTGLREPLNFDTLLHVDQAYADELSAFARAVKTGEAPAVDPRAAQAAVELSIAAVLSSRRGQPVSLPLEEGEDIDG